MKDTTREEREGDADSGEACGRSGTSRAIRDGMSPAHVGSGVPERNRVAFWLVREKCGLWKLRELHEVCRRGQLLPACIHCSVFRQRSYGRGTEPGTFAGFRTLGSLGSVRKRGA